MSQRSGRSLITQTFWLLVGGMIVVQVVFSASLFLLPAPRQEGVPLMEIAERLRGNDASRFYRRPLVLPIIDRDTPPATEPGLAQDLSVNRELADRLGIRTDQVRIYFRPDRGTFFLRIRPSPSDGIVRWRGQPVFYDRAIIAAQIGDDWRMIRTPDRPLIADWQKRMVIMFGLAILALLPLAWMFARRLVTPILAFAGAADRVGRDSSAPMVPEDGPTELRVAARAVNAMQGRISEQLREREAMVAAIAHDLRTPLSRIAFRIEAADDTLRDPIQRDIEQMKAMITTTLSYVRGSSDVAQEPVDLGALLDEIVANEQHVGRPVSLQGAAPAAAPAPAPCTVRGNRVALGRMVQNLVDNAITYGGQADLLLRRDGAQARLAIADRGPGLPADEAEAMFAPFARKERSRNRETGGVGLGLAIARAIARDHGGEILLEPRVGGGLEAVVNLPLAAEAT